MNISRRTLVKLASAVLAVPEQAFCAADDKKSFLRPPGAVSEAAFQAKCNRCQRCVQVCPTHVVVPASLSYGIVNMNTPVVTFKVSYCNSCMKCTEVCPTGALKPVSKEMMDIGVAVISETDCVAWDWTGCTVCVDECPLKAIYLDESKRPVVIPEKCNGCGICELKCPSTALRKTIRNKGIIVKPRPEGMPARVHDEKAGSGS